MDLLDIMDIFLRSNMSNRSLHPSPFTLHPFFCFLLIFLIACSESSRGNLTIFSGREMTIDYRILVGDFLNAYDNERISKIILITFDEVDAIYNKWNPSSELSYLNHLKAGVKVPISLEMEKLLILTDEIVHLTEGRFDPTIEPIQSLWKTCLEMNKIPSDQEIHSLAKAIGWEKIHFHDGLFYKDVNETQLDLGGIAKGYCVDLLVNRLNDAGYKNLFVEWGGEIRTTGQHPDKRPWTIFISYLGSTDPHNAVALLNLQDHAIATSGDYLQNWRIENEGNVPTQTIYFHIIDPITLQARMMTEESIASASVQTASCAMADGIATAAMMFSSLQEAGVWIEEIKQEIPNLSFWLVSRSGKIIVD